MENEILNTKQNFENYVPHEGNNFAVHMAKEIVIFCTDDLHYDGLYLYGDDGVGKTHLLQAVGNSCQKEHSVVYSTIEIFMNEFTDHLRAQTMDQFRGKYRTCDLLLIDDFEYIQGKEQTQEELYYALEALKLQSRKFIIASRKPLSSLEISPALKNILYECIVEEIKPPNSDTLTAIVQSLCQKTGLKLQEEMVAYIVKKVNGNTFKAKGIIHKLDMQCKQHKQVISMEQLQEVVTEYMEGEV